MSYHLSGPRLMGGSVVSQLNAKQLTKIALTLAPVIVFVLLGFLLAGAGEGASEAEVDAASSASGFVFLMGLIGVIGSVVLMVVKPGPSAKPPVMAAVAVLRISTQFSVRLVVEISREHWICPGCNRCIGFDRERYSWTWCGWWWR